MPSAWRARPPSAIYGDDAPRAGWKGGVPGSEGHPMTDHGHPQDENLRMVLSSQGHEEWLRDQIGGTRRLIPRLAAGLVLGIVLLVAVSAYVFVWRVAAPACATLSEGVSLEQLIAEGTLPVGTEPCADANSEAVPAGAGESWQSIAVKVGTGAVAVIALLLTLGCGVELLRSFLKLREYRVFATDHQEFLKKYNRS